VGIAADYRGPSGKILPGTRLGTAEIVRRLCPFFSKQDRVLLAYLFGSYVREEVKEGSDVDVAVLLDPALQGEALCNIYQELFMGIREILGTERFDLLILNHAPLHLKFEVVAEGRLICSRDDEVLNWFEVDAVRRYQDAAHLRKVQNQHLKERALQWFSNKRACGPG